MTSLGEAFESFPAGKEWAVEALARLGMTPDDDTPIRHVAQGWMRLGGGRDALLVDTLFVLTEDRLGFGQTHIHTSDPNWIALPSIVAVDLIEGVPYPLEAIEVQFAGGLAIFVGWPEDLSVAVLDALAGQGRAPMAPESSEEELSELDHDSFPESKFESAPTPEPVPTPEPQPTPEESAVEVPAESILAESDAEPEELALHPDGPTPFAAAGDEPTRPVMPPLFAALERSQAAEPELETTNGWPVHDEPFPPSAPAVSASPLLGAPTTPFAPDVGSGSFFDDDSQPSELEDRFFADLEHRDGADDGTSLFSVSAPDADEETPEVPEAGGRARGPWDDPAMPWPDPFRNCVFLGGHPVHQRRRKNVVVVMRAGGLVVASSGSNGWSVHVPWNEVRRMDIQGADEVKFTHNHRIDLNGSALVVELVDSTSLLVEIRGRRPATVRSTLAPVISMANSPTQPGGADVTAF